MQPAASLLVGVVEAWITSGEPGSVNRALQPVSAWFKKSRGAKVGNLKRSESGNGHEAHVWQTIRLMLRTLRNFDIHRGVAPKYPEVRMTNLISIDDERAKKSERDKEELVVGLQKLLERAQTGELKGICFAGVDFSGDMTLGILRRSSCGVHELVGLAHLLDESLVGSLRE